MAEATRVPSKNSAILKQGEFGYPSGHLGHLSAAQESALVEFKELCAKNGVFRPAQDGQPASPDDGVMLCVAGTPRSAVLAAASMLQSSTSWTSCT